MSAVEHVGFRNQMRARWEALPEQQRLVITLVVEVLVSVLFWFVNARARLRSGAHLHGAVARARCARSRGGSWSS